MCFRVTMLISARLLMTTTLMHLDLIWLSVNLLNSPSDSQRSGRLTKKATKLLEIVDSQFNKTSTRGQSARAFFNKFVLILANKLKRNDIAQSLVTTYSKSY